MCGSFAKPPGCGTYALRDRATGIFVALLPPSMSTV
jgi:hypothetical protein